MKSKYLKPLVISGLDITKNAVKREACTALRNVRSSVFELKANKRTKKINKNNYITFID